MKEYYIQLPKFRESNPDMDNKLNQWLAVIDDTDRGKIEMAKAKNKIIKEAEVEIKYFTASEEAQYLADMRDLWESDVNSRLYDARKEGEKQNKIKIAKKMLEKNRDLEEIMELTELTEEEIKRIKNDSQQIKIDQREKVIKQ